MKFKINKLQVENLLSRFKGKNAFDFEEIELVPMWDTANEAMAMQEIENKAWHKGYHFGFREGYYNAKNERPPALFCGERDCVLKR